MRAPGRPAAARGHRALGRARPAAPARDGGRAGVRVGSSRGTGDALQGGHPQEPADERQPLGEVRDELGVVCGELAAQGGPQHAGEGVDRAHRRRRVVAGPGQVADSRRQRDERASLLQAAQLPVVGERAEHGLAQLRAFVDEAGAAAAPAQPGAEPPRAGRAAIPWPDRPPAARAGRSGRRRRVGPGRRRGTDGAIGLFYHAARWAGALRTAEPGQNMLGCRPLRCDHDVDHADSRRPGA